MTHICVSKQTIIGSDNGLSPGRCQAIIWTNAGILLIGPLGSKFIYILIEIHTFSFKEMHLKMSSGKWRPFCLGLNVLFEYSRITGSVIDSGCSTKFLLVPFRFWSRHQGSGDMYHGGGTCRRGFPKYILERNHRMFPKCLFYIIPWSLIHTCLVLPA